MAEMLKHDAAVACYGRWDDQDKVWNDASLILGAYKKAAIISDVIVDTPEEIEALPDDQEVITPVENVMGPVIEEEKVFILTKGYIVKDEKSYGLLPESYRSKYGEWGTPGLEESLPWLAVEFDATPAKDLAIKVTGPGKFSKKISYPEVEKEVTLLTLNEEELGTELVEGTWKVTVNGSTKELKMTAEPVETESADPEVK